MTAETLRNKQPTAHQPADGKNTPSRLPGRDQHGRLLPQNHTVDANIKIFVVKSSAY
jgi:hypothetical protein